MTIQSTSVTGVANSPPLLIDGNVTGEFASAYIQIGAGCTASVQITPDDVMNPTVTPTWYAVPVAALTGATTSVGASLGMTGRAIRLNQTAGASQSFLRLATAGVI